MAEPLPYRILCPDGVVVEGVSPMVVIPAAEGDMGVMKQHSPMIVQLRQGTIAVFVDSQKVGERFYVNGGIAHITPEALMVLSDDAANLNDLNDADIQAALKGAEAGSAAEANAQAQLNALKSPVYS